jgi:hypothetical protein
VFGLYLGGAGERNNDARVVYLPRGTNHDAGMLADKFGRIGVVRKVDPEILPDARRAGDQPISPADSDPSGGTDSSSEGNMSFGRRMSGA